MVCSRLLRAQAGPGEAGVVAQLGRRALAARHLGVGRDGGDERRPREEAQGAVGGDGHLFAAHERQALLAGLAAEHREVFLRADVAGGLLANELDDDAFVVGDGGVSCCGGRTCAFAS